MKDIVLFGIQGSGKGTQARLLAEKKGLKIFETGAELRNIMQGETELGKTVREIIQRGDLVPNQIVMNIVEHFLEGVSEEENVLFDGLPRSMEQKRTFDAVLQKKGRKIAGVFLEVPKDEVIARMKERGREDDTDEVILRRIENYENETVPVIREYRDEGKIITVDGCQSIEAVHEEIIHCLDFES